MTRTSGWTETALKRRSGGSCRLEELAGVAERLDLGVRLLPALEVLAVAVHPDHRDLRLQARLHVGRIARCDVDPVSLQLVDSARALLEVRRIGLVATHLLRGHYEVEVNSEMAPRRAQELVVDVRQDPKLELLGETLQLRVRLAKGRPGRHAVRQEVGARRLELPAELGRNAHRRAAKNLRVELVGAALDLALDLDEAWDQDVAIDREAVAVRLPLKGVVDPALPVYERAVAVECDELDVFRKSHGEAFDRVSAPPSGLGRRRIVPTRWTSSNTRASSSSRSTACPCQRAGLPRPCPRRLRPPRISASPWSSRRRSRSEVAARPAASSWRATATRPRTTPRRSSAWTSAATPSTSCTWRRPRRSTRSTTRRSSSIAPPRSPWPCSRAWAAWTWRKSPRRTRRPCGCCTWTRCSASRTSTGAGSPSSRASPRTSSGRWERCWPSSTTSSCARTPR